MKPKITLAVQAKSGHPAQEVAQSVEMQQTMHVVSVYYSPETNNKLRRIIKLPAWSMGKYFTSGKKLIQMNPKGDCCILYTREIFGIHQRVVFDLLLVDYDLFIIKLT